jgi:raffinose/stachyose/melibiose transport system permease protein
MLVTIANLREDSFMNFVAAPVNVRAESKPGRLFGYQRTAYLYLLPAFVFYTGFVILPMVRTIYLSFFDTAGTKATEFIGFENYINLLSDSLFFNAFKNNVLWAGMVITVPVTFALFLAVLLARPRLAGRTFFRVVLFLPQVIKSVVVAMIWRWMYNPVFGPVNEILRFIGLDNVARGWLGEPSWALPALALGYSWAYYGFCMVIFLAALQGIDETQYDAAKIDGANAFQQFWYVTLPAIRFVLVTVILFTLIESFKVFDIVFVGTGGGPGYSTWVISIYLFDYVWYRWKLGFGLTSAVVHTLWIAVLTAVLLAWRRRVQENGE